MIPDIPPTTPLPISDDSSRFGAAETFAVRDGLVWLGLTWDDYAKSLELLDGMHGSPINAALLDSRAANSADLSHARPGIIFGVTTAEEVLSKHGISRTNPLESVRNFIDQRSTTW
ncbi:hypothetical protein GS896_27365 [Rhodococcus hoagii]|nr:hypothetical protein [Prescottella equi]MBM4653971.1 hypothetical protein [Prescottella equi]MBM4719763.1 hypothetical protein [Prescottella equi]NKR23563.1 hypothetical protein [Prescottella equi]NKT56283.1 hypothetical protein [Prescottella equi]